MCDAPQRNRIALECLPQSAPIDATTVVGADLAPVGLAAATVLG